MMHTTLVHFPNLFEPPDSIFWVDRAGLHYELAEPNRPESMDAVHQMLNRADGLPFVEYARWAEEQYPDPGHWKMADVAEGQERQFLDLLRRKF